MKYIYKGPFKSWYSSEDWNTWLLNQGSEVQTLLCLLEGEATEIAQTECVAGSGTGPVTCTTVDKLPCPRALLEEWIGKCL